MICGRVEARVDGVRRILVNTASRGFASDLAAAMGWRVERRSRELAGVEKLSLADVVAEIELHKSNGEEAQAEAILAALLDGLSQNTSVAITPGSVIRIFDEQGQLRMRFE